MLVARRRRRGRAARRSTCSARGSSATPPTSSSRASAARRASTSARCTTCCSRRSALYVGVGAAVDRRVAYMLAGVVQRLDVPAARRRSRTRSTRCRCSYIDQQPRGDLLSRVTNDIDNVAQSLQQTLSQMLTSVLLLIGVAIDDVHDLAAAGGGRADDGAGVGLRRCASIAGRARPAVHLPVEAAPATLNAQIEETFTGHAVVKAFGRQHEVEERFRDDQRRALRGRRSARSSCRA